MIYTARAAANRSGPASTLVRCLLYYSQVRSASRRPARRAPCEDLGRDATEAFGRRRRSSAPRRPEAFDCFATRFQSSSRRARVAHVRRDFLA